MRDVFFGATTPHSPQQDALVTRLVGEVQARGLRPRRLASADRVPLADVRDLLSCCQGALVVALVRWHTSSGTWKPFGPGHRAIVGRWSSSPWVQIEAAMAYGAGLPTLVLKEASIFPDGVLDPQSGSQVHSLPSSLEDDVLPSALTQALERWVAQVNLVPQ